MHASSGSVGTLIHAASLASTNSCGHTIQGIKAGAAAVRQTDIGLYYHNSQMASAPTSYIRLETQDGVAHYFWVDDADDLQASTDTNHIGTSSGTELHDNIASDERMKDIYSGDFPYGLSEINSLVPIKYKFKGRKGVKGDKLGFGAQTTLPILPEAVKDTGICIHGYDQTAREDGSPNSVPKGDPSETELHMHYTQIIPVLVKAVQELSAEVEKLKNGGEA